MYDLLHHIAGTAYLKAVKAGDHARAERANYIKRAAFERGLLRNARRKGTATPHYAGRAHATIQRQLRQARMWTAAFRNVEAA